jgi:hypothetical protein
MATDEKFESWAILELMGHRRLGGYVRQVELAGAPFLRIDVPQKGSEAFTSQLYSPAAVYCLTPTTEEIARAVAESEQPTPLNYFEIRRLEGPKAVEEESPF